MKSKIDEFIQSHDAEFRYMMLGRMQEDCKYWLGNGRRGDNYLWASDPQKQIDYMRGLWDSFPADAKPEWLTMEQINEYAQKMGVA